MTSTSGGNSVSLTAHTSRFRTLESCCLNQERQAYGPFSDPMPPMSPEAGQERQTGRRLIRRNTFVKGDYSLC